MGPSCRAHVDGIVVIPEEVKPFCEKCGWF
jgi:hypothetical protein